MKNFAITGVAGYIAPRHLKAIKATGNRLIAALDPNDSVGLLDQFDYDVRFFTEFERFDRHAEKLKRGVEENKIDYVSICSPNFLHDAHIRFALRIGAHAICEKPLVLNPWNIDALAEVEEESKGKVNTVLQLRVHPKILALKNSLKNEGKKKEVELCYITSRGRWYQTSWKGDLEKSGGVASNIGIHFFDMLMWMFGKVQKIEVHVAQFDKMAGYFELENAKVKWFLSINNNDLPEKVKKEGNTTFRSITIDGEEVEFSGGFTDLHTIVYEEILKGNGYGLQDAKPAVSLVRDIRDAETEINLNNAHPILQNK
ncbi:MAG: oxidoreductase [Planctomycetota bacterium]|nr:MAG: oxidoreductase [Planctomycetota bacterium]